MTTLPSQNEPWGFFGTISHHTDPTLAWDAAFSAVTRETRGAPEAVRNFLDSRYGRHFADMVTDGLAAKRTLAQAIDDAVAKLMTWKIDAETSRDYGIPKGLPFLAGWVIHFEIMDESNPA
jgi:hypothetical protein